MDNELECRTESLKSRKQKLNSQNLRKKKGTSVKVLINQEIFTIMISNNKNLTKRFVKRKMGKKMKKFVHRK